MGQEHPSTMRRERHHLLVGRPVLPRDQRVGDAAQQVLHDGVRAPLVAGLAVGVARVHRGRRLGRRLAERAEQCGAAGGQVTVAAEHLGQRLGHRVAEAAERAGRVKLIPIKGEELWRELGVAYRRDRTLTRATDTFINTVRQFAASK